MLPSDYKRNYRFKTDTHKEGKYIKWIFIISIILMFIAWYYFIN
ncbi:hypothetical protein [Pedobacter sp. ASV28]|nr:hypothetical protein [Pedobacter sp. ASV28]